MLSGYGVAVLRILYRDYLHRVIKVRYDSDEEMKLIAEKDAQLGFENCVYRSFAGDKDNLLIHSSEAGDKYKSKN